MNDSVQQLGEVKEADKLSVGGKAANLAKLIQNGLPVPSGLAVGLNAFDDYGKLKDDSKKRILQLISKEKLYAVRSSALAEDAEGASWAGQFETFLDTKPEDVLVKVEECHNSAKSRAEAYAKDKSINNFDIAVVVQEMLKPDYAGVLFTRDPLSGKHQLVTEYVAGLGEELVSGRADPVRIVIDTKEAVSAPFDTVELSKLANDVEKLFGTSQDIEWVWAEGKIWLVQARPITVTQEATKGYYLGEPDDLFYWGPSRTNPMYMSDWLAATEQVFLGITNDKELSIPPKTLVLFHESKMVYLCSAELFADWCEQTFEVYKKRNKIEEDITKWYELTLALPKLKGSTFSKTLIDAWRTTIIPEFSLYGAESNIAKHLGRFDAQTRQKIWGAFTIPDKPTFLARIDEELAETKNSKLMAKKYGWIQDGYEGLSRDAEKYFESRLEIVNEGNYESQNLSSKRSHLIKELYLSKDEIDALNLARRLAEFMDDRKAWMMQTRRLLTKSVGDIEHGWFFNEGESKKLSQDDASELWQRYVNFKASTSAVKGIVASNGGKHFMNGEVKVVTNPTDVVSNNMIVVVPSTSPSYVPLMRKAKALVTDHGGMMSHAAIVAREFNLPCIVGTKQATKVLKDGDMVVLDLVKGEVNK